MGAEEERGEGGKGWRLIACLLGNMLFIFAESVGLLSPCWLSSALPQQKVGGGRGGADRHRPRQTLTKKGETDMKRQQGGERWEEGE